MSSLKRQMTSPAISNYFATRAMNSYGHNARLILSNSCNEAGALNPVCRAAKFFSLPWNKILPATVYLQVRPSYISGENTCMQ